MFCRTLLGLAGYQVDLLDLSNTSNCSGPVPAKKCRSVSDESGCDNDWQQLLVSPHHSQAGDMLSRLLGLDHPLPDNTLMARAAEQQAEVSSGADLGYTIGTYHMTLPGSDGSLDAIDGKYLTIWKRQSDGKWKVAVDMFNTNGPPVSATD